MIKWSCYDIVHHWYVTNFIAFNQYLHISLALPPAPHSLILSVSVSVSISVSVSVSVSVCVCVSVCLSPLSFPPPSRSLSHLLYYSSLSSCSSSSLFLSSQSNLSSFSSLCFPSYLSISYIPSHLPSQFLPQRPNLLCMSPLLNLQLPPITLILTWETNITEQRGKWVETS